MRAILVVLPTPRVSPRDDDAFTVEGDATEARGTGTVTLALTLRVTEAEGGSTLHGDGPFAKGQLRYLGWCSPRPR
ncbi:hypothetical protein [Streptomyces longwoodensis]|uniref:hypothetical protein n=1 Tax=Streptomyces longwoodensis TaxID=68231 RepID=UPI003F54BA90